MPEEAQEKLDLQIAVCIKQVPDTTNIRIHPETNTLIREGVESIINPFDMYALEEALRLKERYGGSVTVLSMGPPQAETALREALSFGPDRAILLSDRAFAGADTLATSLTLSAAIRKTGRMDIILAGKQAMDGDTGQVGPGIAENLDIPHVTDIRKIEDIDSDRRITVQRLMEEGYVRLRASLPMLLTVVKEINEPRLPSLRGKMNAKKAEIPLWTADDIGLEPEVTGLDGSPTQVMKIFSPPKPEGGKVFKGEIPESVATLLSELKGAGLIIGSGKGEAE